MFPKFFASGRIGGCIGAGLYMAVALLDFGTLCRFGTRFTDPCGFFVFVASLPWVPIGYVIVWPFALFNVEMGAFVYAGMAALSLLMYFITGVYVEKGVRAFGRRFGYGHTEHNGKDR